MKKVSQMIQNESTPSFPAKSIKISMWKMCAMPLKLLVDQWKNIFSLALPTALLMSLCSLLLKRNIICSTGLKATLNTSLCSETMDAFGFDLFLRSLIMLFFAVKWYQTAILKHGFSFKLSAFDAKAVGQMILIVLLNLTPLIGLILLAARQVTPDWQVELLYFTAVAWVFLVPIVALRFYSLPAFALEHQTAPSLKTLWVRSSGNMLKFLLGAAVIVFLALFIFMQYYGAINAITDFTQTSAFVAEFEYDVLVTLFTAYWLNYSYVQKDLLFKGDQHE